MLPLQLFCNGAGKQFLGHIFNLCFLIGEDWVAKSSTTQNPRHDWCGLQPRLGKDPNVTGVPDFCLQERFSATVRLPDTHCSPTAQGSSLCPLWSVNLDSLIQLFRDHSLSTYGVKAHPVARLLTYRETLPSPPTIPATSSVPPTPSSAPLVAARIPPPDYSGRSTKHCANRPVFFATNM